MAVTINEMDVQMKEEAPAQTPAGAPPGESKLEKEQELRHLLKKIEERKLRLAAE